MKSPYKKIECLLYLCPYTFANEKEIYMQIAEQDKKWLQSLDPSDREIIELRFFHQYSLEQIAIKLGYQNHSSVLKRIQHILKKLNDE